MFGLHCWTWCLNTIIGHNIFAYSFGFYQSLSDFDKRFSESNFTHMKYNTYRINLVNITLTTFLRGSQGRGDQWVWGDGTSPEKFAMSKSWSKCFLIRQNIHQIRVNSWNILQIPVYFWTFIVIHAKNWPFLKIKKMEFKIYSRAAPTLVGPRTTCLSQC